MSVLLLKQITELFLMMLGGFVLVRLHLLKGEDSRVLSLICVYLIVPCALIGAFQIRLTDEVKSGFLLAVFAAILSYIFFLLLAGICRRLFGLDPIEEASILYTNAGNLILPLVAAVFGEKYLIYASGFMCVQAVFLWTQGNSLVKGERELALKKILGNVNIIAVLFGMVCLFTGWKLPPLLKETAGSLASMVGPVSMLTIGMMVGDADIRKVFCNRRIYLVSALRMLAIPLLTLPVLLVLLSLVPVRQAREILSITYLAVLAPAGMTVTQMAQIYKKDADLAASLNIVTTIFSIMTMPLGLALYEGAVQILSLP